MSRIRMFCVAALIVTMLAGGARHANAQRLITGPFGAVAGTLSGGYISLSIVVLRAQFGHYLHSAEDLMSWNGLPVIIGGSVGTALGVWDPDRLMTGFAYGSIGTLTGGTLGFIIGSVAIDRPEGRWAGGAIGAGLGMAIGSTLCVLVPNEKMNPFRESRTVVPLTIRIPL